MPDPADPSQWPPTPAPDDPFELEIIGHGFPDTFVSARQSTAIVIGVVKDVQPARWTTADGRRPPNPHAVSAAGVPGVPEHGIVTPVVFEVEEYLMGEGRQPQLLLWAIGGTVGQDSVEVSPDDHLFRFTKGERALLFIAENEHPNINSPIWSVFSHYTLTPDGQAVNFYRSLSIEELLSETRDAMEQLEEASND